MPLSRRTLLVGSVAALVSIPALADSTKPRFKYIPSKLGIDYHKLAPSPLAEILSQGEVEWMENAKVDYLEDTIPVWRDELLPQIASGAVSQITIENLREFTPDMLAKFAVGLNPQDPKYGGLWSVGTNYIARKLSGKS